MKLWREEQREASTRQPLDFNPASGCGDVYLRRSFVIHHSPSTWEVPALSETALVCVEAPSPEEELSKLVLNGVTSDHTKRSYRTGLEQFFAWLETKPRQSLSKALVGEYRTHLLQLKLSPSTLNLRLSPLRKLAREMAGNGMLEPGVASAIECIKGVTQEGVTTGNWLVKECA